MNHLRAHKSIRNVKIVLVMVSQDPRTINIACEIANCIGYMVLFKCIEEMIVEIREI